MLSNLNESFLRKMRCTMCDVKEEKFVCLFGTCDVGKSMANTGFHRT